MYPTSLPALLSARTLFGFRCPAAVFVPRCAHGCGHSLGPGSAGSHCQLRGSEGLHEPTTNEGRVHHRPAAAGPLHHLLAAPSQPGGSGC